LLSPLRLAWMAVAFVLCSPSRLVQRPVRFDSETKRTRLLPPSYSGECWILRKGRESYTQGYNALTFAPCNTAVAGTSSRTVLAPLISFWVPDREISGDCTSDARRMRSGQQRALKSLKAGCAERGGRLPARGPGEEATRSRPLGIHTVRAREENATALLATRLGSANRRRN
jgi:hypothetical protein